MRYWKLVLPTLLVALMVVGLINSVSAGTIIPPNINVNRQIIYVTPYNTFIVKLGIQDIPEPYGMIRWQFGLTWDPKLIEFVKVEFIERPGWQPGAIDPPGEIGLTGELQAGNPWTADAEWVTVTFHCLGEGTSTIDIGLITKLQIGTGAPTDEASDPVEVLVHQRPPNVGGTFIATNKLTVLAPYLGLVGLIAAVASAAVIMRRRKN